MKDIYAIKTGAGLSVALALLAQGAVAADNSVFIRQVGSNNKISVTQSGSDNSAESEQEGRLNNSRPRLPKPNTAVVGRIPDLDTQNQHGNGNFASIAQKGTSNQAFQYQDGNNNEAIIVQNGLNGGLGSNEALQIQTGDSNYSEIDQNGKNLYAETIQENAVGGDAYIRQNGIGLRMSVYQTGANPPPVSVIQNR